MTKLLDSLLNLPTDAPNPSVEFLILSELYNKLYTGHTPFPTNQSIETSLQITPQYLAFLYSRRFKQTGIINCSEILAVVDKHINALEKFIFSGSFLGNDTDQSVLVRGGCGEVQVQGVLERMEKTMRLLANNPDAKYLLTMSLKNCIQKSARNDTKATAAVGWNENLFKSLLKLLFVSLTDSWSKIRNMVVKEIFPPLTKLCSNSQFLTIHSELHEIISKNESWQSIDGGLLGFHAISQNFRYKSSPPLQLKISTSNEAIFQLLSHPQLTIREKVVHYFRITSVVHQKAIEYPYSLVSLIQETLKGLEQNASSSQVSSLISTYPYLTEGYIALLTGLIGIADTGIVSSETFEKISNTACLYLGHEASSVRISASELLAQIAIKNSNIEDNFKAEEILYKLCAHWSISGPCIKKDQESDINSSLISWQWREGCLMAYEQILMYLNAQNIKTNVRSAIFNSELETEEESVILAEIRRQKRLETNARSRRRSLSYLDKFSVIHQVTDGSSEIDPFLVASNNIHESFGENFDLPTQSTEVLASTERIVPLEKTKEGRFSVGMIQLPSEKQTNNQKISSTLIDPSRESLSPQSPNKFAHFQKMQFYQNDLRLLSEFLESKELKFAHYIEKFPNTPTCILFRQFSLLQILFDSCLSTQFELKRMSSQFLPKLIDSLLYNSPNFLITILSILINSMKQSATPKHVDSTIALNPTAISKIKPILAQISKTTLEKTLALKKLVSHDISEFEILSNETKQNFRKIIAEIDSGVNCISDFVECVMMRPTSTVECFHALKVAMVLTKYRNRDFFEVSVPSPSHERKFGEDEEDEIDLDELKTTNNRKIGSSILKVFNFAMEVGWELSKSCFERIEHDFGSKMSIRDLSRAGSEYLGDSMGVFRRKSPVGSKDSLHKEITPNGSSFRLNAKNSFHELKAAETHKSIFKEYLEISSKFHPGFINVDNDRRKEITEELSAQKKVLQNLIISMDPKLWQDFIFSLSGQDMLIYLPHLTSLAISNSVLRPTLFQCIQKFLISIIKSKKPRFISQNPVIQKILHNPVSVVKNSGGSNSCLSDGLTRRLSQRKPWKRRFVGTNVKSIGVVLKIKEAKWDEEDLEIYNADILKCSTVLANWLGEVMETKRFGANSLKLVLDTIYLYHIILQSKEILRNDISHILSRIQQDSVLSLELSQRKNLESSSDSNEGDIDNNSGAMDDDSEDEEEHGDLIDVPTNRNEVKEVARLIKSQFRNLKALYDAPVVKQKGNSLPWIVLQDIGDSIFENVMDEFYADSLHNGEIFDWLN